MDLANQNLFIFTSAGVVSVKRVNGDYIFRSFGIIKFRCRCLKQSSASAGAVGHGLYCTLHYPLRRDATYIIKHNL